jgi:hypothetical protein
MTTTNGAQFRHSGGKGDREKSGTRAAA